MLGSNFVELLPPLPRAGAAREALSAALESTGHAANGNARWRIADGTRGWQHWVCHAIERHQDEPRELQAIGYDITDRKRAEESGRQLAQATRFAAVGELTAMVAHEINQPLCAILSNAEAAEIMLQSASIRRSMNCARSSPTSARMTCAPTSAIRSIRSLLQRREFEPAPRATIATRSQHVFKLVAGDALHRRVTIRVTNWPQTCHA